MEFKVCTKCKEPKTLDQFSKRSSATDGLQFHCRECNSLFCKQAYRANATHYKEKITENRRRLRKAKRQEYNDLKKSLRCKKCGDERYYVLTFHHIDAKQKEYNVAKMIGQNSMERIYDEIAKCDVLCFNCHAEHHHFERNGPVA